MVIVVVAAGAACAAAAAATQAQLPRPGADLALAAALVAAVAAGAWSNCRIVVHAARGRCPVLGIAATALCFGSVLQATRDVHACAGLSAATAAAQMGAAWSPALPLAEWFERLHLAHTLGPVTEPLACPTPKGRPNLLVQGAVPMEGDSIKWVDLIARFQPNQRLDNRPVWLQPYTPRLELAMWRLVHDKAAGVLKNWPRWFLLTLDSLVQKKGSTVLLAVGREWQLPFTNAKWSWTAEMHEDVYYKAAAPLPQILVVQRWLHFEEDVHSNKWWAAAAPSETVASITPPRLSKELRRAGAAEPACAASPPWASDLPLSEAVLALFGAVLVSKLMLCWPGE